MVLNADTRGKPKGVSDLLYKENKRLLRRVESWRVPKNLNTAKAGIQSLNNMPRKTQGKAGITKKYSTQQQT